MRHLWLKIILIILVILIAIPFYWSLSPSGAVRTRMLIDLHPVQAILVKPYRSYDKPKPKGLQYSYATRFNYKTGPAETTVAYMMVKKQGFFYFATPTRIFV